MSDSTNITPPTEQDARQILHDALGKEAVTIYRFPTDSANYVYGVTTKENENLVIRLARPDVTHFFDGALFWYKRLKEKEIPIPELYYSDGKGQHGFPIMIMERLPGADLGTVYDTLTREQKELLAERIVKIQQAIGTLPKGKGFGFARSYDDTSLYQHWIDVLTAHLDRSRERIRDAGIINEEVVDKVKAAMMNVADYFAAVTPTCFLADITTKNVVVSDGILSGIVDFDCVAFGDPLYTIALTRMSLLSKKYNTDYTNFWTEKLNANDVQKQAIDIYTLMFCVVNMSEIGLKKDTTEQVNQEAMQHLNGIFESLMEMK